MDRFLNANIVFSKFCNEYAILKKDLPIRPSEMGVLNIIVLREGLYTPLNIAELLEVSKPMITAHVNVLEKKGYVTRKYLEEDRRSFYVLPTTKAKQLVKATSEKMNNVLSQLEGKLGENNFSTLIELLVKAHDKIKEIKGE